MTHELATDYYDYFIQRRCAPVVIVLPLSCICAIYAIRICSSPCLLYVFLHFPTSNMLTRVNVLIRCRFGLLSSKDPFRPEGPSCIRWFNKCIWFDRYRSIQGWIHAVAFQTTEGHVFCCTFSTGIEIDSLRSHSAFYSDAVTPP